MNYYGKDQQLYISKQICSSLQNAKREKKMRDYTFKNLKITFPFQYVIHVELNRPTKLNAFDQMSWRELHACFEQIAVDSEVRVVVISGAGRLFTAGIDLNNLPWMNNGAEEKDLARRSFYLRKGLIAIQNSISSIELCDKPVIAVVHNGCIGGGVDLITACDIRYCSQDAFFSVKEVDLGLAADVGTLQRLPKIVGNNSLVRELCLTGRNFSSTEALNIGLVNKVLKTKEETLMEAFNTAKIIASKSPVATLSTKHLLNFSRDHSVTEGLAYTAIWNGTMINSIDLVEAFDATTGKRKPKFSKL